MYDTLLTTKRKRLHGEIGAALEEVYKNSLSDHYELLAEHFFQSENFEKAEEYSKLAGRKAEKKALLNDAIAHVKKRIISLERLPRTEEVQRKRSTPGQPWGSTGFR